MSNIHELEESLYAAWNTVDDIGLLKEEVQGVEAREAVEAVYWLLDARMNRALDVLEEYHANERGEVDKIAEIMYPTPTTYRSIYEDEGALLWKPYRTGQVNTHLTGNFRTVVVK